MSRPIVVCAQRSTKRWGEFSRLLLALSISSLVGCAADAESNACGEGERFVDGTCSVKPAPCGFGTRELGGLCVADGSEDELECGEGTARRGNACVVPEMVSCGEGTVQNGDSCVLAPPETTCGAGTRLSGTECIPENALACGAGTLRSGNQCVPGETVTCGAGTALVGNACLPADVVLCGPGTRLEGDACVPSAAVSCGVGTMLAGDLCVPSDPVICGPGTTLEGDACVPSASVTCGAGTTLDDDECVPSNSVACGVGTVLVSGECRPSQTLVCGNGTVQVGGACLPSAATCGPGTRLDGTQCVPGVTSIETSQQFRFGIAEKGDDGVVYFLDSDGTAVHRFDLTSGQFLSPYTLMGYTATTMAVSPAGDTIYLGSPGGRINVINTETAQGSFLVAAPETPLWMQVADDFLFTIDGSGAWETHATYRRSTGERVFSDDWRNVSYGAAYAPGLKRIFTFRDGTSPNDIFYSELDTSTGQLGTDTESPYHGDYPLGHPIRVSPDETRVFVASGVAFSTSDLTYATAIGYSYVDLAFHEDSLYLLRANGSSSQLVVLNSTFEVVETIALSGQPLRLFVEDDALTVFTRTSKIATWQRQL